MYNEIWESVETLLKPINSMAKLISIPELTFDLMNSLRLNLKENEYSDSSRYKRVIKQPMTNPIYQLMNIIFDYEDSESTIKSVKMMYEGKITLVTIIPYRYITHQYNIDGPLSDFMLNYLLSVRVILVPILHEPFSSIIADSNNLLLPTSLHSIPLLYTKWMTSVFGTDKEVTHKIIDVLAKAKYPALFTSNHIVTYIELLRNSSIEKLLDYSLIATEDEVLYDAYTSYKNQQEAGIQNAEDISAD